MLLDKTKILDKEYCNVPALSGPLVKAKKIYWLEVLKLKRENCVSCSIGC